MAILKTAYYAARQYPAETIKTFFDSFSSSLFTTSITGTTWNGNILEVYVDNTVSLIFNYADGYVQTKYNGSVVNYSYLNTWNALTLTVAVSDNMLYVQWQLSYSNRTTAFLYEKIDNKKYWGAAGGGADWYSIVSIPLTETSLGASYAHGQRISGTAAAGTVLFTGDALFSGGVKSIEDPNFLACSTLTANTIITMNNKNYYTVGANTLMLVENI